MWNFKIVNLKEKIMKININKLIMGLLFIGLLVFIVCEVDVVNDFNNFLLGLVIVDVSKVEFQVLVIGLEVCLCGYVINVVQMFGSFGCECYVFFGFDFCFLNDWLGLGGNVEMYFDFFVFVGMYVNFYLVVK